MGSVGFAHPLYLWGLLATALPIVVHLFNQRRPRPLAFGAIDFVLRSQRQKARRLRLRQILLLALRCLLVAGVAVALARPQLQPKGNLVAAPAGPQATALVLDASLSMRYRVGQTALFEKARTEALGALDRLGPDEPATVVLCAGPGGALGGAAAAPSFDRVAARRLLAAAQPTYLGSDLTTCLAQAARALGESPVPGKRIIAFSDLAAHSLRLGAPPPLVPPPAAQANGAAAQTGIRPNVVLVDAASGRELPNAAVVAVAVQAAPALGPRGYEVVSTVANFSGAAASGLQLSLRIGAQTLAKGFVDVPARSTAKKVLGAVLPAGPVEGRVELARDAAQGLDEDDGQDFVVQVPRDVRALIVDGAPSSLRTRDEAYFAEAALSPLRTAGRVSAQTLDADAAAGHPLEGVDVVLLLDVPAPTRAFAERLRAFVQRGGGLFIALGEHVDPDAYDEALGDLLPRPLHLIKTAAEPGAAGAQPARFGAVDWSHPLFRVFSGADREGLQATRTQRYALLKPGGPQAAARPLLSFDDGAPALVEARLGAGRILLCTTSASMAWTDWPIRVSYLPVLQQAVAYLSGALEEKVAAPALVGDLRALVAPAGARVAQVLGPDGKEVALGRTARQGGTEVPAAAASVEVGQPGVYRVRTVDAAGGAPRDEPALFFAAHADPRESDLRRVDEAELKAQLGGAGSAQVAASAREAQGPRGTPLWSALLLLGVLALLGEGALTRR